MGVSIGATMVMKDRNGREVEVIAPSGVPKTYLEVQRLDGQSVLVEHTEPVSTKTDITIECDGPSCAQYHNGKPSRISWNQEAVGEGTEIVPDSAWPILTLQRWDGSKNTFCSARCAIDALVSMKPLSPPSAADVVNIAEYKNRA